MGVLLFGRFDYFAGVKNFSGNRLVINRPIIAAATALMTPGTKKGITADYKAALKEIPVLICNHKAPKNKTIAAPTRLAMIAPG